MSECESDYLVRNLRLQEELSACRKELEDAKAHNELYAAEMSGAKEAGWYSAEELFSAYKTLTDERDRLAASLEEWKKAAIEREELCKKAETALATFISAVKKD